MKNKTDQEQQPQRLYVLLIFILIGICVLYTWVSQSFRPIYNLSQNQSLPLSINATKTADYSPDFFTPIGNIRLGLIFDILLDLNPDIDLADRQSTLLAVLQTPVAYVTLPAGSVQPESPVPATLPVVEPPTTAPPTDIPDTPVAPAPKPKKTKKEPPTTTLAADPAITKDDNVTTYSASGSLTYTVTVTNNSGETVIGAIVADIKPANISKWVWECSESGGASGCDPVAIGSSDFSDTVNLPVGGSIVYTISAIIVASPTGDLANTATISVPSGYTDTDTGNNSATDTDNLDNLYINIIVPINDGFEITNTDQTKFEAESWDSNVGTNNGDGITSVTFDLKDSSGTIIPTFVDSLAPYCVFDGSPCSNAASAGFIPLTADTYTIEATVLSTSAITKMVTRTFVIP